jgi:four helix bundle protein|tara:strand:- start:1416 stop:1829 length:414 start_codon:yes stop_codon:yes gene_type:complete
MTFAKFEDIRAWQEARELNRLIHQICERAHVQRDKKWIEQITSASLSIMSNIAEGNDAISDVEFARFLGFSKRSASEVRSQLYYALDKKYINQNEFDDLSERTLKISAQIANLINYLYKSKRRTRSNNNKGRVTSDK